MPELFSKQLLIHFGRVIFSIDKYQIMMYSACNMSNRSGNLCGRLGNMPMFDQVTTGGRQQDLLRKCANVCLQCSDFLSCDFRVEATGGGNEEQYTVLAPPITLQPHRTTMRDGRSASDPSFRYTTTGGGSTGTKSPLGVPSEYN